MEDLKEFDEMIDNMKHTIGFDNSHVKGTKYRRYEAYRNYFTGSDKSLDKAVKMGLMTKIKTSKSTCGDFCYSVTKKGFEYLSKLTGVEITEGDK